MSGSSPDGSRRGAKAGCDMRCHCGSLLARLVNGVVELKCRRCKRTILVPLSENVGTDSK